MIKQTSQNGATLADVARKAHVSVKTVSRVVNNEAHVSAATRSRVKAAVKALDYRPNEFARNLASQRQLRRT